MRRQQKKILLGIGMDGDGHKRITKGDRTLLIGGSKDTHEIMQEKAIKIHEALKRRGKNLDTVPTRELEAIARELNLRRIGKSKI